MLFGPHGQQYWHPNPDLIEELRSAAAELANSRDEMKAMAVTDPLTRCYNRRLL